MSEVGVRGCSSEEEQLAHNQRRVRSSRTIPTLARCPSGQVTLCKSVQAGSIPARASRALFG